MTLIEPIFCAHMIIIYDASETAPFLMRRIIKFSRLLETHRYFVVVICGGDGAYEVIGDWYFVNFADH